MLRVPGRRFILRFRWQPGHEISTRGTCFSSVKKVSQVPHFSSAGRWSTPATSTLEHDGQEIFSSFHLRRVSGWSTRTRASQRVQLSSPRPTGSMPLHFGHERAGGDTLDSTRSSSDMTSLLLGIQHELFRNKVPRDVKSQSKFLGESNDQLLCAHLVSRTLEVKDDDIPAFFVNRQ